MKTEFNYFQLFTQDALLIFAFQVDELIAN